MHADHVEFSWDASKSSWLLRIEAGEEVTKRISMSILPFVSVDCSFNCSAPG